MTDELPHSTEEKAGTSERWLFAHELKSLLDRLKPGDWLTANKIGNLLIEREIDGVARKIGIIDFRWNQVDLWDVRDASDASERTPADYDSY